VLDDHSPVRGSHRKREYLAKKKERDRRGSWLSPKMFISTNAQAVGEEGPEATVGAAQERVKREFQRGRREVLTLWKSDDPLRVVVWGENTFLYLSAVTSTGKRKTQSAKGNGRNWQKKR